MDKKGIAILFSALLFLLSCSDLVTSGTDNLENAEQKENISEPEFYKLVDYCNLYYVKAYTNAKVNNDGRYSSVYRKDYRTRIKPKWDKAINNYTPPKYSELRGDIGGHKELSVLCDLLYGKRNDYVEDRQGNDLIEYLIELPYDFERREFLLSARDDLKKDLANKILKGNFDKPVAVEKPDKISLSTEKLSLKEGKRKKLKATITPDIKEVELLWSSNNNNIAEVNQNGEVYALKTGNAVITVSVRHSDIKDICIVEVTEGGGNTFLIILIVLLFLGASGYFLYKNNTEARNIMNGCYVLLMRPKNKKAVATPAQYRDKCMELKQENQELKEYIKKLEYKISMLENNDTHLKY